MEGTLPGRDAHFAALAALKSEGRAPCWISRQWLYEMNSVRESWAKVHADDYGMPKIEDNGEDWRFDRCCNYADDLKSRMMPGLIWSLEDYKGHLTIRWVRMPAPDEADLAARFWSNKHDGIGSSVSHEYPLTDHRGSKMWVGRVDHV